MDRGDYPRYYAFTQIKIKGRCPHIAVHRVRVPNVSGKGFYRAITSYNAFVFGENKRCYSPNFLYYGQRWEDYVLFSDSTFDIFEDMNITQDITPIIDHSSIWDFYKYIGYDHKKNKYKE